MTKETRLVDIHECAQCGGSHKAIEATVAPRPGYHCKAWWEATCPENGGLMDVEIVHLSTIAVVEEHPNTFSLGETFRTGRVWPSGNEQYPYDTEIDCQLCGAPLRYRNKTLEQAKKRIKRATPHSAICEQCMVKAILQRGDGLIPDHIIEELKEEWEGYL